jgi:uncharacterized protein
MSEVAALQARFGSALDAPDTQPATRDLFVGEPEELGNRLGVYRGNVAANAARAMQAAYPVVAKIVGTEFFLGLTAQYRSRFPSREGDLNEYGEYFAAFLADFAPAREMAYLRDVARLEWQVHRAHYAADRVCFDAARLASVPAEQQLRLRPGLHPACHVLHSRYPLARLWEVHQAGFDGEFEVDFSQDPGHVLVFRPRFKVAVARIEEAEAAFLGAALAGETLQTALTAAQARNASFDLGRRLREWIESSVIVDFDMNAG